MAAATALGVMMLPSAASAGPSDGRPPGGDHCVTELTGMGKDGGWIAGETRCYPTYREALNSIGIYPTTRSERPEDLAREAVLLSYPVSAHFEHAGWTGLSQTLYNGTCSGWVNLASWLVNKVSSSISYCNSIGHHDAYNGAGARNDVIIGYPVGANLTTMNDLTNSVSYT